MRIRLVIIATVIFALVGGTFALRVGRGAPRTESGPAQAVPVSVAVATAQRADFITSVSANGTVASLREAKIASTLQGIVAEIFVTEGQRVPRGAPLLQLKNDQMIASEAQARAGVTSARATLAKLLNGARPEELRQAAAAAAQTKAALDLAQTNLERMRSLYAIGAVSQQTFDAAESQFRQSQAANAVARDALRLAQLGPRAEDIAAVRAQLDHAEATLASAQIQVRDSTVTAPFAGTIARRLVEPGEAVSSTAPAFILAQLDTVYAELAVPERDQVALRTGQAVAITIDALPDAQFAGTIAEIQPTSSVSTRSFIVKVRVRNPQGVLRPGMFARGTITVAVRPNVLQVPDTAVLATSGKPIAFVVQDGRAVRREVTLGERRNGMVEITDGLTAGEAVVVSGVASLTDAQPVTVRPAP